MTHGFITVRQLDHVHRYQRLHILMHQKKHPDPPATQLFHKHSIPHQKQPGDPRCMLSSSNMLWEALKALQSSQLEAITYHSSFSQLRSWAEESVLIPRSHAVWHHGKEDGGALVSSSFRHLGPANDCCYPCSVCCLQNIACCQGSVFADWFARARC